MNLSDPTIDATFHEYADLQLRRHNLLLEEMEQDPTFDKIEDRMTELWEKMDNTQRQSVNGMASDLNWIRRRGEPPPKGRKAEAITQGDISELLAAKKSSEWHKFLHYLRLCGPAIPSVKLAYMRADAYASLELPFYAIAFYEQAADLDPANGPMGVIALRAIDRVDHARAVRRAEEVISAPLKYPPVVIAMSAAMVLRRDEEENRPIDRARFAGVLSAAVDRLALEPPSENVTAMTYQLAAAGFETIDDLSAALRCYNEGLRADPDNEVLLVGKGLLLYGSDTGQAVEAFKKVAKAGTPLVWPYFFLTHYYLIHKEYDESLNMGHQAWVRARAAPVRAELLDWQAICLSETGYPPEVLGPQFEKAISLDPANDRIKRNLAALNDAIAAATEPAWDIETAEVLRVERAPSMSELELVA